MTNYISPNEIRAQFSAAMSEMYRKEVPAYGQLVDIVEDINQSVLADQNYADEDVQRISAERHGAIRVGTADELSMLTRIFAVMGMEPVSYYDLGSAGIPVHSTAFRPVDRADLAHNPFRVFTSLLRLDLIDDPELRQIAEKVLKKRQIFTSEAISLTQKAERQNGLSAPDAALFVSQVLETFRWTGKALVSEATYQALHNAHRLIADVVCFTGPHINHLTPRTLDIDLSQQAMVTENLPAKAVIEGPPRRLCPILLRQTSFKALREDVVFDDSQSASGHTARFGEIEQRGVALTPKGRALYDALLSDVRQIITPKADGSNAEAYCKVLADVFAKFPDEWEGLHNEGLAYFRYDPLHKADNCHAFVTMHGVKVGITPIIYEDFLPVSAAGIFQSNLGDNAAKTHNKQASKKAFEEALGRPVIDEFEQYQKIADESLKSALSG
ncbi:MAG: VOC family protein [Candidatus Puniceispirillaceae bacterium]